MTSPGCSSCTSGPMTMPRNWRPDCARRWTRSTWPGARAPAMYLASSLAVACVLAGPAFACLAVPARAENTQAPLVLERTIPLANVSGRIDHMAVDLRRGRLFVAELGNNTVDVVDVAAGRAVHRIGGLHEPQGVGYAPAADVIAVANAGDGSVRFYKGEDFSPAGQADLGDDADN